MYDKLLTNEPDLRDQVKIVTQLFRDYPGEKNWITRWDEERVGFPIAISFAIFKVSMFSSKGYLSRASKIFSPSLLAGLIAWGESKMIYRFDTSFAEELGKTKNLERIPIDALLHMPFKSICIQVGNEEYLVFLDQNMVEGIYELRIEILVRENFDSVSMILDLSSDNLQTCIDHTVAEMCRFDIPVLRTLVSKTVDSQRQAFITIIQMLLYLQSENIDIEVDVENTIARKHYPRKNIPTISNIGYRIGADIRKIRVHRVTAIQSEAQESEAQEERFYGSPKSAHIRRAHWHRFWTGSRNGERKLIIRWVAPMVIHPENGELITTICEVKEN